MTFVARAPSLALAPFVERLGLGSGDAPLGLRELILPTGAITLALNLADDDLRWYDRDDRTLVHVGREAAVLGACAGPVIMECPGPSPAVAYVTFRPGRAYPFLSVPGSAIDEPLVDLEALWGRDGAVLRERLLEAPSARAVLAAMEAALAGRLDRARRAVRPPVPDRVVLAAAALLCRGTAVAQVADRVGWTGRTLQRRFGELTGLTPKRFARVRRLQRLIARIPPGCQTDWALLALECGYFDQAHLVNEFRALTGLTPGVYRPLPCGNHHLPPRLSDSSNTERTPEKYPYSV